MRINLSGKEDDLQTRLELEINKILEKYYFEKNDETTRMCIQKDIENWMSDNYPLNKPIIKIIEDNMQIAVHISFKD